MKTNFNERERSRHAKSLREVAEQASKAADGLENGDDKTFLLNIILLSFSGKTIFEILQETQNAVDLPGPMPEFPDFVEE